jgi:methyl-accepting chemotaxis protein
LKLVDGSLSEIRVFLEATTNNIRRRVALIGILLIVAPMAILGLAAWVVTQRFQPSFPIVSLKRPSPVDLTHLTKNLVDLCRIYQQESVQKLKGGQTILDAAGRIRIDPNQTALWHAKNEVTGEVQVLLLPVMTAGDARFLPVADFSQIVPVVDEIAKVFGTPATIFQRINARGDMLRISSSMKSLLGARAIGSFIPAGNPDTQESQLLQDVLHGKTYLGKELQAKVSYLTAYQPLKNSAGDVVGMLATALPEDQIRTKVKPLATAEAQVDHVELFVFQATGETRGTALVMSDSLIEGSDLWNEKDFAGRPYVKELCSQALKLSPGQFADLEFQRIARTSGLPLTVFARFAYIPELEWVVGFVQPETNILADVRPVRASAGWVVWLLLGVGVAGTGLAVRIWIKFSEDMAYKLNSLLAHLRSDAKQLSDAAAALSQEANRALAANSAVRNQSQLSPASNELVAKAAHMIQEIRSALQHIDASSLSLVGMIGAIDQITFATNLLMVNAAIQASNSTGEPEPISGIADELRLLAEQCRKAARITKTEIEQSRAELEKGNRDVLKLLQGLRSDEQRIPTAADETAFALRRQADALLRLAEGLDHTVEVINAGFGGD